MDSSISKLYNKKLVGRGEHLLPPLSLLLLDDDLDVATSLSRTLIGRGHTISVANSGAEALVLAEKDFFDVICCDVNMPVMSGVDFMRELRARSISTPVLVLTGEPSSPLITQMRDFNIVGVVYKPFTVDELLATLVHILFGIRIVPL